MIKLFEEYNEYYTEVSEEGYHLMIDNLIYFDQKELENIETYLNYLYGEKIKVFSILDKFYNLITDYDGINRINWKPYIISLHIKLENYNLNVSIRTLKDEWYLVKIINKLYKCDQLEGLKKLLNDSI